MGQKRAQEVSNADIKFNEKTDKELHPDLNNRSVKKVQELKNDLVKAKIREEQKPVDSPPHSKRRVDSPGEVNHLLLEIKRQQSKLTSIPAEEFKQNEDIKNNITTSRPATQMHSVYSSKSGDKASDSYIDHPHSVAESAININNSQNKKSKRVAISKDKQKPVSSKGKVDIKNLIRVMASK